MRRTPRSVALTTLAVCAVTYSARASAAVEANEVISSSSAPWRVSVKTMAGSVFLDPSLTNYRWDVEGAVIWGLAASAGRERWALGLRVGRTSTTQGTGIPGETQAPTLRLTSVEATGELELVEIWRLRTAATGHAGRLHLGYAPDRLTLDPLGGGSPFEVEYAPIDDWIAGAGVSLAAEFVWSLALGLHVERSFFWLSTLHRTGTEIEERRERFGNWAVRLALSWSIDIP